MDRAFVVGKQIYLRPIDEDDIDSGYLQWVNSEIVYSTLASLYFPTTKAKLQEYIRGNTGRSDVAFFAIVSVDGDKFIGTAKIGPIQWIDRHSYCALLIGDAAARGKGYGSEVAFLLLKYGFRVLNLRKISAGMVASNAGSIKIFEKAGMKVEARLKEEYFINGELQDHVLMAMFQSEFFEKHPQ